MGLKDYANHPTKNRLVRATGAPRSDGKFMHAIETMYPVEGKEAEVNALRAKHGFAGPAPTPPKTGPLNQTTPSTGPHTRRLAKGPLPPNTTPTTQ